LINKSFVKEYKNKTLSKSTNWTAKAGTFKADPAITCQFTLPEFHQRRDISWNMYVNESDVRLDSYDLIIGRMQELGIDLLFSLGVIKWENETVPMRGSSHVRDTEIDALEARIFSIHDPDTTDAALIQEIMDVKYAPADIDEMVSKCTHLKKE
jgi:hypothetical protein